MRTMLVLPVLLGLAVCFAQTERGNIAGLITDASKSVIPNVPVKVINPATGVVTNVATSSSGEYNAANLPPGAYRVEIAMQGFQTAIVEGVTLTSGSSVRVDVSLQVGGVSQSVEVQAQNTLMQTEDSKISTAVSNKMVDELPLVVGGAMRSAFDLVSTVADAKGGSGGSNLVLGGGQGGAFATIFDGVSVNTNRQAVTTESNFLTPSVEAITEFSVDTNGYKAEFGQAGGGVISFASKSGTNDLHGSGYDFIRNQIADARSFFAASKSIYKQNDFGATLGGPVWIPKVYNGRNRTFFFFSYEGFRNRQGSPGVISSVPTPEMYQGNFTNLVNSKNQQLAIYDPDSTRANPSGSGFVRDAFPGNVIPASRFSKVSNQYLALAKGSLLPNRPGIVPGTIGYISNNYVSGGGSSAEGSNKVSIKVDHSFNSNHRISYLYNRGSDLLQPGSAGPAGLPVPFNSFAATNYIADIHRATYDWTVSSHMFNHFSFGLNTFHKDTYSINVGKGWKSTVCIVNAVDCNVNFGNVSFTEFSTWGGAADNGTDQPRRTWKDDFSYLRGSHSMKFGFTYDHQEANGFGQQNIAGLAGFSFLETAVPGSTSATSGSSFASFLLGDGDTAQTETVRYLVQLYRYYAFYAQDDWRVSRKLMVNFGVRYEFTLPPVAGGDQYSDFSPTTPNPAVNNYPGALIFAGTGAGRTGTRTLIPGYYGEVSPRLGFAYSVDPKTTIRGGVARSFGRLTVLQSSSHYAGFIGQYAFTNSNQGITPTYNWDQGLPSYPLPPQINPAFANNTNVDYWNGQNSSRPAEYDNWTFSIQHELAPRLTVEADYNAAVGSRMPAGLMNINQVSMSVVDGLIAKYGATQAISLMNSNISSAAAVAAGFKPPYANFTNSSVQQSQTVSQSLRAFPQYLKVDTQAGGGDRTGHSFYNAAVLKVNYRATGMLMFQGSYIFSKILTNADSYASSAGSEDQGNRFLEKSVGAYDQTHTLKLNTVFDLPFGRGKHWLAAGGIASRVASGWRLSATQSYNTGFPIGISSNGTLPIFNGVNRPMVTTYDWKTTYSGSFDPNKVKYLDASVFPTQPVGVLGNAPRENPRVRVFPGLNENVSLAKTFSLKERLRVDIRAEAFNIFNRVVFGTPVTSLNSTTFGVISSQANSPRQMQGGLKFYW